MPKITFITADGTETTVEAEAGSSVMQVALAHNIDAIRAECGGAMACATCHAYVDAAWSDKVGPATGDEAEMLEFASCEVKPTSRLSCQIEVTAALDGLVLHLPEGQV